MIRHQDYDYNSPSLLTSFKLQYFFDKLQLTQVQLILLFQYFFFQDFELKAVNGYTLKDVGLGLYSYNFYDITQKRLMYWHSVKTP